MSADYELLFKACQQLEEAIEASVFGAAKQSHLTSNVPKKWDKIVRKLNDIKLIKAKTMFLRSLTLKDKIEIPDDLTLEDAIKDLNMSTEAYELWNTAIETKLLSKAVYFALQDKDEEIGNLFSELLSKISRLDKILYDMDEETMSLRQRLSEAKAHWRKVSGERLREKMESENVVLQNGEESLDSELRSRLFRKMQKIETLKVIQGKLLASCETYDWLRDPENLQKYLVETRREPYKIEDFIYL